MKKKTCCYLEAKTSNTKIEKETSTANWSSRVLIDEHHNNKLHWIIIFHRIFHSIKRPFPFDSISIECNAGTFWLTTQQSSWRSRAIRCLHLDIPSNYSICVSFVYFCLPQALWFVWYLYIFFPSSLLLSSSYSITTTFRLLVLMSILLILFQVAPTYSKLALPIGH